MPELIFLVNSIFSLVVGVFLLRLLFQLMRADFRNPFVQAIVRLTNPVVMPLRRILPPIGRVDTASVVAVIAAQLVQTALVELLYSGRLAPAWQLLLAAVLTLLDTTLFAFLIAIFAWWILGMLAPDAYNPVSRVLSALVEPILRPFRRALPTVGGFDLSPLAVTLLIIVLRMILNDRIRPLLLGP
jgi:YggT family protein